MAFDEKDARLKFLLSEKEHIDSVAHSQLDLQLRNVGLLLAGLTAAAGWILSGPTTERPQCHALAYALLGIVLLGFLVVVLIGFSVAIAGAHLEYRRKHVVPAIAKLTAEGSSSLDAEGIQPWVSPSSRSVMSVAFAAAAALQSLANVALVWKASRLFGLFGQLDRYAGGLPCDVPTVYSRIALVLAIFLVGAGGLLQWRLYRAMVAAGLVGRKGAARMPAARDSSA